MKSGERSLSSSTPSGSRSYDRHIEITGRAKTDAVLRLLQGESVAVVSQEMGVSVGRIERWKNRFVEAGSAEIAKRRDVSSQGWVAKHSNSIRQWTWLLLVLIALISLLAVFLQRASQE